MEIRHNLPRPSIVSASAFRYAENTLNLLRLHIYKYIHDNIHISTFSSTDLNPSVISSYQCLAFKLQ